jgi:GGDEF domain-containing protein
MGRRAGEVLLRKLEERWTDALGNRDTLADLGGRVALLVPGATEEAACEVAEGLLLALEHPLEAYGATVELGGSIGIAVYPDHAEEPDTPNGARPDLRG